MSITPSFSNIAPPDLNELLTQFKQEVMTGLNCHAIGTINSFDPISQTAVIKINYKKTIFISDDSGALAPQSVDYPALVDCPVITMSGGAAALTFPIAPGDTCLVLFNDRDIDNWFESGTVQPVNSFRLHSLADGIALIGLRSLQNVIGGPGDSTAYDTTRVVLRQGKTMVGVGPTLVKIANQTYTLNTLLQELITDISNLVTQVAAITVTPTAFGSPTSPPINAAAITALAATLMATGTKIAGLLE